MQFYDAADELAEVGPDFIATAAARAVLTKPIGGLCELPSGVTIACISDTHQRHEKIKSIPHADVLVHAGDFCDTGHMDGIRKFTEWMDGLPHRQKIFIAGNHDTTLHSDYYTKTGASRFHARMIGLDPAAYSTACREIVLSTKTCTYLEDSSTVIIDRSESISVAPLSVYGSPWQPEFCDWAFNLDRGEPCAQKWSEIPIDTDVLITHGPPYGFGDRTVSGFRCGCVDMMNLLISRVIKPRLHIFGHIHEDVGAWYSGGTLMINASTCNFDYRPLNRPIMVHLPFDRRLPPTILQYDD